MNVDNNMNRPIIGYLALAPEEKDAGIVSPKSTPWGKGVALYFDKTKAVEEARRLAKGEEGKIAIVRLADGYPGDGKTPLQAYLDINSEYKSTHRMWFEILDSKQSLGKTVLDKIQGSPNIKKIFEQSNLNGEKIFEGLGKRPRPLTSKTDAAASGLLQHGYAGVVAEQDGARMIVHYGSVPYSEIQKVQPPKKEPIQQESTERSSTGVNMERLIDLFGSTMYKNNLADVTVKELLQNSFDAVKSAQATNKISREEGRIEIEFDQKNASITVRDNGAGMTPKMVQDAFLKIAGTDKSDLDLGDRSGGFGIAKMAFLFGNKELHLRTVRDGIETSLSTNGHALMHGGVDVVTKETTKPPGTEIQVVLPTTAKDRSGQEVAIEFPSSIYEIKPLQTTLLGDVDIVAKYNNVSTTLQMGRNATENGMEKIGVAELPWGSIDIYFGKDKNPQPYFTSHTVLSSGLEQFQDPISHKFRDAYSQPIPYNVTLDVRPKVDAADPQYPFSKDREGWNKHVKEDVKQIYNLLRAINRSRENGELINNMSHIVAIESNPEKNAVFVPLQIANNLSKSVPINPTIPIDITKTEIRQGDVLLFKDDGDDCGVLLKANKLTSMRGLDENPLFHDNLQKPFIESVAVKANAHPQDVQNALMQLGQEIKDFRNKLEEIDDFPQFKEKYPIVGLSIDKNHHGVYVKSPFEGFFLNPASAREKTPQGIAHGWAHTLMHEATHAVVMDHNEQFTCKMADLYGAFEDRHPGQYQKMIQNFTKIQQEHAPIFQAMFDVYRDPLTKNAERDLEGSALRTPAKHGTSDPEQAPKHQPHEKRTKDKEREI